MGSGFDHLIHGALVCLAFCGPGEYRSLSEAGPPSSPSGLSTSVSLSICHFLGEFSPVGFDLDKESEEAHLDSPSQELEYLSQDVSIWGCFD